MQRHSLTGASDTLGRYVTVTLIYANLLRLGLAQLLHVLMNAFRLPNGKH